MTLTLRKNILKKKNASFSSSFILVYNAITNILYITTSYHQHVYNHIVDMFIVLNRQ